MTWTLDESDGLELIAIPAPLPPSERAEERARWLAALHDEMATCRKCQVAGYLAQANPVAGFRGRIGARMLLVGQAPGRLSALKNEPFSGPGGRVLEDWLERAGFAPGALRREVYLSALTRCDPGRNPRGARMLSCSSAGWRSRRFSARRGWRRSSAKRSSATARICCRCRIHRA
jgi:hypothetical protein